MTDTDPYPALTEARNTWRYSPADGALSGRTILVTGAGSGLGAATARSAALYGANVVLLGRTRQKLEAVFDWIEAHTATQPVIVPCDLAELDPDAVAALNEAITGTYDGLHGIVHCASLLGAKTPLVHYPPDEWQRVMQVNANAPFLLNRGLFGLLDATADSAVIHVSSTVGREGRAYWGAYSASKFALEGISQILADETETAGRIRVYSVNPGGTRTPMRAAAYPMEDPETVPTPEARMDLMLYLLEGAAEGKTLPAQGAQLDARDWQPL